MELNTCILRQDPIHITFVPAINPHYLLLVLNSRCHKLLGCYPFGSSAMHTQTTSPSGIDYALALAWIQQVQTGVLWVEKPVSQLCNSVAYAVHLGSLINHMVFIDTLVLTQALSVSIR